MPQPAIRRHVSPAGVGTLDQTSPALGLQRRRSSHPVPRQALGPSRAVQPYAQATAWAVTTASSLASAEAPPGPVQSSAQRWAELLVASGKGHEACFTLLAEQVRGGMRSRAMRVLNDPDDAEEVVQESLIEAWYKADRYDPRLGGAMSWLGVIVRCRAIDLVRRTAARRAREHQANARALRVDVDDTADVVLHAADRSLVRTALPVLTDKQRQAVQLVYYEGLSNGQAAAALGIPIPTLKSRLREAVCRLRQVVVSLEMDQEAEGWKDTLRPRSDPRATQVRKPGSLLPRQAGPREALFRSAS
jgi:RNA polymerase sigma-70 factor (ECF subfamily)